MTIETIVSKIAERISDKETARLQRAVEALKSGEMKVFAVSRGRWLVASGQATYNVARTQDGWSCSCPDFTQRHVRCKHIFATYLAEKSGLVQLAPKDAQVQPSNGHEEASGDQAQPQPSPNGVQDQAAPTGEGLEDPVVPFGRHRGKRLSQIAAEDPDFLFWIIRKMEVRSDADQALKDAARRLAERIVREKASQSPDEVVVPFGEEKGTPLTRCHPKWVAVLAKKGLEDAFNLQDAVTYEVARRLQAQRQQERRKKSAALDAEAFLGAMRLVILETIREAIPAALEAARQQEADREAILADLRRRVEALEKASRASAALAAREAMLAAR